MPRWLLMLMILTVSLFLLSGACAPKTPTAATAADFYKENTVTLVVPFSPGGGTDYAGRIFASYWFEVTGGNMVVRNEAGAGGVVGNNYVYAAEPDGLTIGATELATVTPPALFEDPGVKFDPLKFNYIGLFAAEPYVFSIGAHLPYKSMEEFQKAEGMRLSATGIKSRQAQGAAVVAELFQLKDIRLVVGYKSAAEQELALGRGEVDGLGFHAAGTAELLRKGYIKPPFFALDRERCEAFPDVPALPELIKLSSEQEKLLAAFLALGGGKTFIAPPGTPEDRVEFMRDTFDKIVTMKGFLKQAGLRWEVWAEPLSGKETAAEVQKAMATKRTYIAMLQQLAEKYVR